jgi:4-amino-4-deoxy-L-arabinose transferase-like glycosyltransferase
LRTELAVSGRRLRAGALAGVLLLSAAVQAWVAIPRRIHWNSDQAVVAIMASDILQRGVHPVFYYGSVYAGSLEPHWVAAVFAVLGRNVAAYRIAMGLLLLALIVVVYRTARRTLGEPVAILSGLWLALPPWFFLYKGLTSDGAYASLALLSAVMVYCSIRAADAMDEGGRSAVWIAGLGFAAGLGWWVDPLIGLVCLPIALWFLVVRPRVAARFAHYPAFVVAFLAGSFPWWIRNLRSDWASLRAPELASVGASRTLAQLGTFFTLGLPILLGSRPVLYRTDTWPGEALASALLYLVPLAVAIGFVWKSRSELRTPAPRGKAARALLLLVLILVIAPLIVARNNRADLAEPRYLFLIYAAYPIVFGFAIWRLGKTAPAARAIAAALVLLALFSTGRALFAPHLYSRFLDQTNDGSLASVVAELDQRGIRSVYASYWVAYRLDFETGDRIAATPFGDWRMARIDRYRDRAAKDPRPAFVLYGTEADRMDAYLAARGDPYQSFTLGPFKVYLDLPEDTLNELRAAGTIPEKVEQRRRAA